ncbi:Sec23/Sec24 zinc finger-containing protein [Clostridium sp.]|uniref:Sec23/Sec24 zinc finger-containing protein n=1 Tax=Clostridium sp. TaxID=1506 RepID=UPI0026267E5C|nr:Sec23/Sec24 zinc finger-containing protein [Clostridium sp.]
MSERFPNIDWWCDGCNAYLNNQSGFNDHKYIWKCTECGYKSSISGSNICESKDYYKNQKKS